MSSYATVVHQAAYGLLTAYFGPRFKTYRMTPMLQVTPADLPILAVHILRERRITDGQANERVPGFKHELTLGYSGAVQADTDDQNKLYQLEQTMSELDDVLFTNPNFVKMVEGFESMDRVAQYAKVGETTLFEIRVECVMGFSSWFDPVIPDWLEKIHVTTQFPSAAAVAAGTPQIEAEYEFDTGT